MSTEPDPKDVARALLGAIQEARASVAANTYILPKVFGGPHDGMHVPETLIGTLAGQQKQRPTPWIRLQMPATGTGQLAAARYVAEFFKVAQPQGVLAVCAYLHEPDREAISDALWKLVPSVDWTA